MPEQWLTRAQAAAHLNLKAHTLEVWAARGMGPQWYKIGRLVRYRQADLDAWIETCKRGAGVPEPVAQEKVAPYQIHLAAIGRMRRMKQ